MTTVVNTPGQASNDSSGMGMIIGVIVLIAVLFLIFFYGMPFFRGTTSQQNNSPTLEVPEQVDVNVNNPQ